MDLAEYARRDSSTDQPTAPDVTEPVAAWEEIEEGRYQPRRVRGSCQGRELG
ncbi:MAG TPA: hypothetical protein VFA18_16240 [Gemmataceae bacterium]|nr:hypothetical protein [Gemmataceae bacterium]